MNDDGTVLDYRKISDTEGGFDAEFNNEMYFGKSIDLAGDINGDGEIEILVGAGGYNNGEGSNFGSFYLINLTSDGVVNDYIQYTEGLRYFDGDISAGDSFGFSVAYHFIPDVGHAFISGAYLDNEGGIEQGSIWYMQLGEVLSITEIEQNSLIKVYPNPSKNSFSLTSLDEVSAIYIFDTSGRQVLLFEDISENIFDVSYLPIGQYLIRATLRNGSYSTFKLIKE
jgi:hypothetical protein